MKKLRVFLLLFFVIFLSKGQQSPLHLQKLLYPDPKDQVTTSALYMQGHYFFSVPTIDTVLGNKGIRKSYIVKVGTSLQVIDSLHISADSLTYIYLDELFVLKHPVTQEQGIGFVGKSFYIDKTLSDTTTSLCIGWANTTFTGLYIDNQLFKDTINYINGNPVFPFIDIQGIEPLSDTTFLMWGSAFRYPKQEYDFLLILGTNSTGFYIADSIHLNTTRTYYKLYKKANGNYFLYTADRNGNGDILFYPFSISGNNLFFFGNYSVLNLMPSYLSYNTGDALFGGIDGIAYGDSLFLHAIFREPSSLPPPNIYSPTYEYLYILTHNGTWNVADSLQIDTSFSAEFLQTVKSLAISDNFLYSVIGEIATLQTYEAWLGSNYTWIHDTTTNYYRKDYFRVQFRDINNFQKIASVSLGGDAYYGVHGIIAPSDSVCIVYGWRFPLGDLTRIDGDAFIWKITWDGLVTPILGKAPKYVFKIFPNPTKNILKISGKTKETTTFLLRSTDGKEVLTQKFPAGQEDWELDVSQIPRGIYLLEILTEGGARFTEKVVLE